MWAAIPGRCRWVRVYFLWRPNLPDEADNPFHREPSPGFRTSSTEPRSSHDTHWLKSG